MQSFTPIENSTTNNCYINHSSSATFKFHDIVQVSNHAYRRLVQKPPNVKGEFCVNCEGFFLIRKSTVSYSISTSREESFQSGRTPQRSNDTGVSHRGGWRGAQRLVIPNFRQTELMKRAAANRVASSRARAFRQARIIIERGEEIGRATK